FVAYLMIGVFMYIFTVTTVVTGSKAMSGNRGLVSAFNFPRMTLLISINVREMLRQITTYLTMFALILIVPPFAPITWIWLMFFPIVALQFLFNLGLSLVLARIVASWNDFTHIIAFATRIWMYMSAVFYSTDRFADIPIAMNLMNANPLLNLFDLTRDLILYDSWPDTISWAIRRSWTVVILIIGTIML